MEPIPTPVSQGLRSSTFRQPPIDGSLSLAELYDWQGLHSPTHSLFVFEDAPGSTRIIPWSEGLRAMHRATRLIRQIVEYTSIPDNQGTQDSPVVSILASTDTITFATCIVGVLRSGLILFPLSPRNSPRAIADLLVQTRTSHLFVSSDKSTQELAKSALNIVKPTGSIQIHPLPTFEELYPAEDSDLDLTAEPLAHVGMEKTVLILHSSGTTGFPKPIYITNRSLIESASLACFGKTDLAGSIVGCHSLPMFHGMGMVIIVLLVSTGMIAAVFRPRSPPTIAYPANTLEEALVNNCAYIYVTPAFIEAWSEDMKFVKCLAGMKGVIYGTAPLTKEVGNILASNGVNVIMVYALTQTYIISDFLQGPSGMDWEYFRISPAREAQLIENGNNEFEIVLLASKWYTPSVVNAQINGRDAYTTGDLVSPHPTKAGYWKIIGRKDEQIVHSNGEKTNPGPLERILLRDSHVSGAVFFGRGRFQCGVLVEPKEAYRFDTSDPQKLSEFKATIWPTIEAINSISGHSRIFKETILVASSHKPFLSTPKGTARRQAIIEEYADEINAMYADLANGSLLSFRLPHDPSLHQVKEFLRGVMCSVLSNYDHELDGNTDLFEMGLDSLQALWAQNIICRAMRSELPTATQQMSLSFLYENPSVNRLAQYIFARVTNSMPAVTRSLGTKQNELNVLFRQYTDTFDSFNQKKTFAASSRIIVLLTGGTGSLGSNILARLLSKAAVAHIYAVSRPSQGVSAKTRHLRAFEREGLDTKLLESLNITFLNGNAEKPGFGVDDGLCEEMRNSVTHIIHAAWRVNFNLPLTSFQPNVRSVWNLANFASRSSIRQSVRLIFIGTTGIFQDYTGCRLAPEEHLEQPVMGSGYTESKWISEQILRKAAANTGLSITIVRCGQLYGGPSGSWNDQEWFPSLIRSSIYLGKLPGASGSVSWVAASDAAEFITDILDSQHDVLHVVHPRPTSWSSIIQAIASEVKLPIVPYPEWFASLESSWQALKSDPNKLVETIRENPAAILIDFFRYGREELGNPLKEPFGISKVDNGKALAASAALQNAGPITTETVNRWLSHWHWLKSTP